MKIVKRRNEKEYVLSTFNVDNAIYIKIEENGYCFFCERRDKAISLLETMIFLIEQKEINFDELNEVYPYFLEKIKSMKI